MTSKPLLTVTNHGPHPISVAAAISQRSLSMRTSPQPKVHVSPVLTQMRNIAQEMRTERLERHLIDYAAEIGLLGDPEEDLTDRQAVILFRIRAGEISKKATLDALAAGAPEDWATSFGGETL